MHKMKGRVSALCLTAAILLSAFCYSSVFAAPQDSDTQAPANQLPKQTFDENNIKSRFGVISDTHLVGETGVAKNKFVSALEQLKAKANGNLDAVLVAGDFTDYGKPEQAQSAAKITKDNLDLKKTNLIIALGNHELYDWELDDAPWRGGNLFKDVFGDDIYKGATAEEITSGNYHTTINGNDFIAVNCIQYSGGVKYKKEDINWLKAQLEKANTANPGKPIYVISHPMITGTNWGSDYGAYWAGSDLYEIFKAYPQVIYFAGHLHFPVNDERSIWQGDFTAVGTGSVNYASLENTAFGLKYIDIKSSEPTDCKEFSQGLYVEVDKNNNTKITRMDFYNKGEIKSAWIIPAPDSEKNFLKYYTNDRNPGNKAPEFPKGAVVKQVSTDLDRKTITFEFDQAIDDDMTYNYQISIIDSKTDKVIGSALTYSDFYKHPKVSDMASKLQRTAADYKFEPFTVKDKIEYYIQIEAIDSYGLKSAPIKSVVYTGGEQAATTTATSTTASSAATTTTGAIESTAPVIDTTINTSENTTDKAAENTNTTNNGSNSDSNNPKTGNDLPAAVTALFALSLSVAVCGLKRKCKK